MVYSVNNYGVCALCFLHRYIMGDGLMEPKPSERWFVYLDGIKQLEVIIVLKISKYFVYYDLQNQYGLQVNCKKLKEDVEFVERICHG